jgi:CopG-like RHH_1 or ribbon-helix-helix domain, RHH_5
MSTRIKITLADDIAERLDELAAAAGQPLARVAGQLVRDGLSNPSSAAHGSRSTPGDELTIARAPWLEPYGGDREWRQFTWGSILALSGRYPEELKWLKDGWWTDDSLVETLCAFALWRQILDDRGRDPREELEFQLNIVEFGRRLRQASGGVTKEWTPGAPPAEWC